MTSRLLSAIHTNLVLLDFDSFLKKESKTKNMEDLREISNTPDLFVNQDKKAFHAVTYFLLHCLSHDYVYAKWLKQLKGCFPCVDRAMESDFRKITADFFSSLQKETDFHSKKMPFTTVLMNVGKEPFLHVYLKFTAFVLTKQCSHDDRAVIRSLKSHQPVDGTMRENIELLTRCQQDIATVQAHLLVVLSDYRKKFVSCAQERDLQQKAAQMVESEWQSVFSNDAKDTCDAYIKEVLQLNSQPSLCVQDLLTQIGNDLSFSSHKVDLMRTCSGVDIVNRVKDWGDVGRAIDADVKKVPNSFILSLVNKNSTAYSFVQKTDSDVCMIVSETECRLQAKLQSSKSLRQQVLQSDCMALAKKQIADQIGLHNWLNLNMAPVPVPTDGTRKWREREKQRQQVRMSQAAALQVQQPNAVASPPITPFSPNQHDSLHNFSLLNTTVEMSRLSMLELSNSVPDFLLDTSTHYA